MPQAAELSTPACRAEWIGAYPSSAPKRSALRIDMPDAGFRECGERLCALVMTLDIFLALDTETSFFQ
jgi:hypothetical protein